MEDSSFYLNSNDSLFGFVCEARFMMRGTAKIETSSPSLEWICFFKAGRDSSVVGNQSSPCPKMGPYMDVRMVHCKEGAEEIIFVTKGNFSYQIKFDRKFMLRVYI